ncbi:hypothetical protein PQR14_16155 [Paraburkholderia bryophila]|uniref:hypothetical protein n=1 Tax=Burkholderiaceae TaxID=119060 RepID=UPI0012E078FD|nr:hypothetical protein [Burkholderia sp. 9120]
MFCAIGSDAAAAALVLAFAFAFAFAPSVEDVLRIGAAGKAARWGASPLAAVMPLEDAEGAVFDAESSAPQPVNTRTAIEITTMLAKLLSFLMSASSFVKADAVSNPFKK